VAPRAVVSFSATTVAERSPVATAMMGASFEPVIVIVTVWSAVMPSPSVTVTV
jgi:hypothetical protein